MTSHRAEDADIPDFGDATVHACHSPSRGQCADPRSAEHEREACRPDGTATIGAVRQNAAAASTRETARPGRACVTASMAIGLAEGPGNLAGRRETGVGPQGEPA